jgi:competence protein ComEC
MFFRDHLFRPVHISWFIACCAAAIVVGAALAGVLHVRSFAGLWLLLSGAFCCAALVRKRVILLIFAIIFGLGLGMWRGGLEQKALQQYAPFYGKTVMLQGVISEDTSYGPHGDQRIMLQRVAVGGRRLPGQVWVSLAGKADLRRSDTATISGKLGEGIGNLPASMFFAHVERVSRPQPGDVALRVRDWFAAGIKRAIPAPESALGVGFLVGQRSALPADLDSQLKVVGLTHAVVASGYNLTILVVFARRIFLKKSKYLALVSAAVMAGGFMLVTGFSPSMTRAGIVTALGLGAWYYGRKVHPLVLLPLAAAITVILNPAYVWGDIGWALSFAAFAGVLLLAPLLHHFFWGGGQPGAVREIFIGTIAAQLATMPIMIFAFGQYSPYALLANLLVLPLVPLAMVLTFAAGIGGLAVPGVAHWFGAPATLILQYMVGVVGRIANFSGAQASLTISGVGVALAYGLLIALILALWRTTSHNFTRPETDVLDNKFTTYI